MCLRLPGDLPVAERLVEVLGEVPEEGDGEDPPAPEGGLLLAPDLVRVGRGQPPLGSQLEQEYQLDIVQCKEPPFERYSLTTNQP